VIIEYNGLNFKRFYQESSHSHSNNVALFTLRGNPHWQRIDKVSTKSLIIIKLRRDNNGGFY